MSDDLFILGLICGCFVSWMIIGLGWAIGALINAWMRRRQRQRWQSDRRPYFDPIIVVEEYFRA